jgi:phosphatidate cytidylyltransferase
MNNSKIISGLFMTFFFLLIIQYKKLNFTLIIIFFLSIIELLFNFFKYKKQLYLVITSIIILVSNIFFIKSNIFNFNLIFNLIIRTIMNDISQEFFGKIFGRIKITKISPNKTLEGYLGGFLINLLLSNKNNLINNLIIYFFNIFGDLYFSYIKRKFKIKDYSKILLSHGGLLDRFDSIIILLFVYGIYIYKNNVIRL